MPKFEVKMTVHVETISTEEAAKLVQLRMFGPDFFSELKIDSVVRLQTLEEKYRYWQEAHRDDVANKTVENDVANQFYIVEYLDAAIEAHKAGAIPLEFVHVAWSEVKKWWSF